MIEPSLARQLFNGDLFGQKNVWPPNIKCYFAICTEEDIITILCGGTPQKNVFGRYSGTRGEHVKNIIDEIRRRARKELI